MFYGSSKTKQEATLQSKPNYNRNARNIKSYGLEKTPNTVSFTNSSVPSKDLKQSKYGQDENNKYETICLIPQNPKEGFRYSPKF